MGLSHRKLLDKLPWRTVGSPGLVVGGEGEKQIDFAALKNTAWRRPAHRSASRARRARRQQEAGRRGPEGGLPLGREALRRAGFERTEPADLLSDAIWAQYTVGFVLIDAFMCY